MRLATLTMLVLATLPGDSRAHARRLAVPRPVLVRIEGHVGPPAADHPSRADLTLRRGETTVRFQVDEVRVSSGDVLGADILREIAPYKPNLTLAGPETVLDRLAEAPAGELLLIVGFYRRGSRVLLVSNVEPPKDEAQPD